MEKFNNALNETSKQYDETLKKLAAGEQAPVETELLGKPLPKKELYVSDLENLLGIDCSGLSSLSRVGVELVDRRTKERLTYIASSAWVNSEWDEITITVDVDKLPKVE